MQIQEELLKPIQPKINADKNEKLTPKKSLKKLKTAIFQMENEKSLGIDGFPIEFYKSQFTTLSFS